MPRQQSGSHSLKSQSARPSAKSKRSVEGMPTGILSTFQLSTTD
nr:MAG TPA: hypothetical protein [Caudoviricetes sp.]